jgi:AraC family transcriptional regulator
MRAEREHLSSDQIARSGLCFVGDGRPEASSVLPVSSRDGRPLVFARYRHDRPGIGIIEPAPMPDQIAATVEMRPLDPTDVFRNGRYVLKPAARPGALSLYDYREAWAADLRNPFDNVSIFLPLSSLREFAAERNQTFVELRYRVEQIVYDEVMLRLAQAIMPVLESANTVGTLYLDHLFLSARDHLAETYGVFSGRAVSPEPSLSSRQLHAALEYIEVNLGTDLCLADIAKACASSTSSLTRCFRNALSTSPHQWVLKRRIALAQRLLRDRRTSLGEIAVRCGFFDQSHLSRAFTRYVGTSPGAWQRIIRR